MIHAVSPLQGTETFREAQVGNYNVRRGKGRNRGRKEGGTEDRMKKKERKEP